MDHPTRRLDGSVPAPPPHCLRCGGPMQVFPTATGEAFFFPVRVFDPDERPSGWTGKRKQTAKVNAHVCLDCGFTEFYTVHPRQLLGEHESGGAEG